MPLTPEVTSTDNAPLPLHPPLLVFHDRTPFLTVRSLTGLIEIDDTEVQLLGVDTNFWIAIVLTYLEFLEEREVSDIIYFRLDLEAEILKCRRFCRVTLLPLMTDGFNRISAKGWHCI